MLLLGLTGCQSSPAKEPSEAPTAEAPPAASVKTVSAGDTEMEYAVFGSGERAFVILPGLSVHSVMGSADAIAEACGTFDCSDALSAIRCPVLVLGSEGDRVVTAESSTQLAEALGCELYLYDGSYGHGVYDEAPDYKQRCLDFLRGR